MSSRVVRGAWPDGCAVTATPDSIAQRTAFTTSGTFATSRTAAGCWSTLTSHGRPGLLAVGVVGGDEAAVDVGTQGVPVDAADGAAG